MTPAGTPRLWLVLLCPLPAVVVGAAIAAKAGAPVHAFATNAIGVAIGVAIVIAAARTSDAIWAAIARWAPVGALASVLATFWFAGTDGIHRWVSLGGVALYVGPAVLPWALLGWTHPASGRVGPAIAVILAVSFALQPDAASATVLAAASLPSARRLAQRLAWPCVAAAAAWAWHRDLPLPPVAHVEGIVGLARDGGLASHTAALVALGLLAVPALWGVAARSRGDARVADAFLFALVAAWIAASLAEYPIGVLGAGAGPVLGWYGFAALLVRARRAEPKNEGP